MGSGNRAGDRDLALPSHANEAIGGNGKFQSHLRPVVRFLNQIGGKALAGFPRHAAGFDFDARSPQHGMTLFIDAVVGIGHRRHHAGNAGIDQRLRAGRCTAMMGAGLERDIGSGASREGPGLSQCQRFCMRPAAGRGHAASNHVSAFPIITHQNTGDRRIGACQSLIAPRQADGGSHEAVVLLR